MILPSARMAQLFVVPALASLLLLVLPEWVVWIAILDVVLVGAVAIDLLSLPRRNWFDIDHSLFKTWSLEQPHEVKIYLDLLVSRRVGLMIWDALPPVFDVQGLPFETRLNERQRLTIIYRAKPTKRGRYQLDGSHILVRTRWELWQRKIFLPDPHPILVYPNLRRLLSFSLLARTHRESMMGVKKTRSQGGDQEFERLRDYIKGDELRTVDWKATAKRRKLTVRNYILERNQNVVFILDCGRMMTSRYQGLTLLDQGLNALLLLSHVALKQGDRVGLIAFGADLRALVPLRGGMAHLRQLIHAGFDLFPRFEESHFDLAFEQLSTRFRKRTLAVLITHVLDEVNGQKIKRHMGVAAGRHLPLFISYHDPAISAYAQRAPQSNAEFYDLAAACEVLDWRRRLLADLKANNVLLLESSPDQLSSKLINRYLEIKARHLL